MTKNSQIALKFLSKIASLEVKDALAFASEDAVFQGPDGTQLDKVRMSAMFDLVIPKFAGPMQITVLGTTCEGNRVAVEAKGQAPLRNGLTYKNNYHYSFEIRDGVITAFREYCCTKAPDVIFQ